jgi:hypothetical protein
MARMLGTVAVGVAVATGAQEAEQGQEGPKLRLFEAFVDSPLPGVLTLLGQDFPLPDGDRQAVVCFGEDALPHSVVDAGEIQASLPMDVSPGSYRVTVRSVPLSADPLCPEEAASPAGGMAVFEVAVGAIGPQGADGAAGTDGTDGPPGAGGASCSVSQGDGSATVSCSDGTSATVFDGADGLQGSAGTGQVGAGENSAQESTVPWAPLDILCNIVIANVLLDPTGACGGSGSTGGSGPPAVSMEVGLLRPGGAERGFDVRVAIRDELGQLVAADHPPVLVAGRGDASPVVWDATASVYRARVAPDAAYTGEYPIRVEAIVSGASLVQEETALVLDQIHPALGQPRAVRGLVNTAGTEDSAAISGDGEWLFLQYTPTPINCRWVADVNHPFCHKARGPWAAPERPGMPGAGRISWDGSIHHGCSPHGLDPAPFPVGPVALYGFRRQPDGTFAQPFVFEWSDANGCVQAYGPSVRPHGGGATMYLTVERVSSLSFSPGQDIVMGRLGEGWQVHDRVYADFGYQAAERQGNVHVYHDPGGAPVYEFWDNEDLPENRRRILFSERSPSGAWSQPRAMPAPPFNSETVGETQSFFDGEKMVLKRGPGIAMYRYLGGPLSSSSSWLEPEVLLATQDSGHGAGSVVAVGEPTIARRGGREILYFVYAIVDSSGDGALDLNVGYVEQRED